MDILAIDFETQSRRPASGPDPYTDPIILTAVSLANGESFVFEGIDIPEWVIADLKNPSVLKLAHSLPFEAKFIQHNLGFKLSNVWDTLAIERLLTAGKGLSCALDEVCLRRLGIELDKTIRLNMERGIITDKEREYAKLDAAVLIPIYQQQKKEVLKNGQKQAARIENYASLIAGEAELKGIGFDLPLWFQYVNTLFERRGIAQGEVWDALGFSYSMDLFTGVPVGGPSLNSRDKVMSSLKAKGIKLKDYKASTLQEYLFIENNPEKREVVKRLLDYKTLDKMLSWGYDKQVHPITGRIHAHWNPQGADTFRWTCSDPNLMQVSRPYKDINFRHLFKASPVEGILAIKQAMQAIDLDVRREKFPFEQDLLHYLETIPEKDDKRKRKHIGADYSQIELRILAYVSGDKRLKEALNNNVDLHTEMAENILKRPIASSDERTMGKIANFGVRAYGGGVNAFLRTALDYGVYYTPEEAEVYVAGIKEFNEGVEDWGKQALQQLQENGYVQTPVGHKRYFFDEDRETVARNTPIQCFAAGVLKDAMTEVYEELQSYEEAFFNLQVHDEMGTECYEEDAEKIEVMVNEVMRDVGEKWAPGVGISADSYIADSWEK